MMALRAAHCANYSNDDVCCGQGWQQICIGAHESWNPYALSHSQLTCCIATRYAANMRGGGAMLINMQCVLSLVPVFKTIITIAVHPDKCV